MPRATMEQLPGAADARAEATVHALSPQAATTAAPVMIVDPISMLGRPSHLGTRQEIQTELDVIAVSMRAFHLKQPDQVMREISAFGARLTELYVLLHRHEAGDRQYTRVRTQQVQIFMEELERQYKIASRMVEVMRQDLELLK